MKQSYQIGDRTDSKALAEFLAKEGQFLLPMLELIEQSEVAIDELIDVMGRATIEAVLLMSAEQVAGPKTPGKKGGPVRWHGEQDGVVALSERKVRIAKPRLRHKEQGEVCVPAYDAMQSDSRIGQRMLAILMKGVSTRHYGDVLPEMADTVGIAKSSVSRQFIEASEESLKALCERRFEDKDILIVYIDGLVFAEHHVLAAVGVDTQGYKHVLGLVEGASENAVAATALLEGLVERGLRADRRRLFVIDGSKALRKAITTVFGAGSPVQRCRSHKVRNVMGYLPDELKDQVKAAMKGAFRLDAVEGIKRLEKQAQWLDTQCPSAATSLREGLDEMFTVNRIGLSKSLSRCLTTTNLIESPNSGVRTRTGRVSRWQDGSMVLRWAATAFLDTEKSFRRIMGYQDLWQLKAYLDEQDTNENMNSKKQAA